MRFSVETLESAKNRQNGGKEMKKKKDLSIKGQIESENAKIIIIVVAIVVLSFLNLVLIDWYQNRLYHFSDIVENVKDVTASQYQWLYTLSSSINGGDEAATPEMDIDQCSFGVWYEEALADKDDAIEPQLNQAYEMHQKMHEEGAQALALAKDNTAAADQILYGEVKEAGQLMISSLIEYENYYQLQKEKKHSQLVGRLIWAIITNFVLAIAAYFLAKKFSGQLSRKISEPIEAVISWSEELAKGAADLGFDTSQEIKTDILEVQRLIADFESMAKSIQDNVNVVQKVADGDMTAFVNIRSSKDTLGKNLYRMVQNNDLMFAEITQIAESVASGADNIAQASGSLAKSCSVQAEAVQEFSEAIVQTGEFIADNNRKTEKAKTVSDKIQEEIKISTEKMEHLLEAMSGIRDASEKVSAMIGIVEDIADQTNLLALNATIEAAMAGDAGRGFSVVANEVKQLAIKSSEAADASKKLIGDTLQKTELGDGISKETSQTFQLIIQSIQEITAITQEIAEAGAIQQKHIAEVKQNIAEISDAIDNNAAASEETASSSDELSNNANELKMAMDKFNLRKRTPGKPYIPPEKQNDPDFIQTAEQNYKKALQEGRIQQA